MNRGLDRDLVAIIVTVALIACIAYAIHLITSSIATLAVGVPWYWWMGIGMFGMTVTVPLFRPRHRCPAAIPRPRAEEVDLGKERWEFASRRDSYLEAKQLRRVA